MAFWRRPAVPTGAREGQHRATSTEGPATVAQNSAKWLRSSDPASLWTVAHQAPLSVGISRKECWSGLSRPPQGIFPSQGLNPHLLSLLCWQMGSLPLVLFGQEARASRKLVKKSQVKWKLRWKQQKSWDRSKHRRR